MLSAGSLLLAVATVGIQWGWEPASGGGNSYIVQVEPELIDTFREQGFTSDVPPELRDIRRIEIRVGAGALPHQGQTVLKVTDKGAGDATKPPRLDAAPADSGAKPAAPDAAKPTAPDSAKLADDRVAPKHMPNVADAIPLRDSAAKPADQTSYQTGEPTAARRDDTSAGERPRSPSEADPTASREPAEKPWTPFLAALGALIVSGAGNLYLGWVHLGTRRRYREVVGQLRETDLPIAIPQHDEL